MLFVWQHQGEVDRRQQRKDKRLDEARQEPKEQEGDVQGEDRRPMEGARERDGLLDDDRDQHVLAEDVAEETHGEAENLAELAERVDDQDEGGDEPKDDMAWASQHVVDRKSTRLNSSH